MNGLIHIHLTGLGLVPAESRKVRSMPASIKGLVPKPEDKNITVKPSVPDTERDTMPLIISKAKRTAWQTKELAAKLKGSSLSETLRNDSDFILDFIKYKKDDPAHEQIRSPRRLVYEGAGDCDCFAVCLATLLVNQKINFKFRIAKYKAGEWAHIYVVVPKDQKNKGPLTARSQYTVLDPVTNKHDYEVTYSDKKDYDMALQYLDGFGTVGDCKPASEKALKREYVPVKTLLNQGYKRTQDFITENNIPAQANSDGTFSITTAQGQKILPALLSPDQLTSASSLLVSQGNGGPDQKSAPAPAKKDTAWMWLVGTVAVALGAVSLTSASGGMAGTPGKKIPLLKI